MDGSDPEKWKHAWDAGSTLPFSGTLPGEVVELCGALGSRVPTLEEWLWAAWGGREDRRYPWGNARHDPTRLNIKDHARVLSGDSEYVDRDGFNSAAPVGSFPRGAGRWGHLDLAGNIDEMVFPTMALERSNDDYSEFCECGLDFSVDDDVDPERERTFRNWRILPCTGPEHVSGNLPHTTNGFRCAADPAQPVSAR